MGDWRGVYGSVVEDLGGDITAGHIKPGEAIVTEDLCEVHQISRTVVREVTRTLAGKGLVRAKPAIGTLVLPVEQWNLLDPDVLRWRSAGPGGERIDDDIAAFRQYMSGLRGVLGGNMLYDALMTSLDVRVDGDRETS